MNLVYTYPAAGKYETDRAYSLDELLKELPLELIKEWFTPVNGQSWSDLELKPVVEAEVKVTKSKSKTIETTEE